MIVSDITIQAVCHKGMNIDSVYARTHLNEAMHILAMMYDSAKIRSTGTISCTDVDTYYAVPDTIIKILRVDDSSGDEYNKLFYNLDNGYIKFQDVDTYTLTYLIEPTAVTTNTETPLIHELYHRTLAKYIAYKELLSIKPDEAINYRNEFFNEVKMIDSSLRNAKKRGRVTPVRQFR